MPTNNSKQTLWIGLGSFFSFLVGIVSPMILSRYLDKGDYGTFKQVMFVYNTLLTVFSLGLPKAYAYFLPKYGREYSRDIIKKITSLFIFLGIIFSIVLFSCSGIIAGLLKNDDLSLALKVFAPTPLFLLPTIGLEGIYSSFRKTQYIALYTFITRTLTVILTVLPVILFGGGYIQSLVGFDIASLLTCILALTMKSLPVRKEHHKQSPLTLRQILKFSIPLLYASLWGVVLSSANQFFISRYYGNEVFAEFSNGFMEIPFATMVLAAIATVLLPRFSEMEEGEKMNDEVYALWQSSLEKSAKIIFPILVFSVMFAKLLMLCLYGDNYGASTIYFQIKNVSSLLYIIPFAPIILAIGKTKQYADVHMVAAILLVVLEFICVHLFESPILIAIVSECCQALKIYLMMRIIANYAGRSIRELVPFKPLAKVLVVSLLSALVVYVLSLFISVNKYILITVCALLFCFVYYALCFLSKVSYRSILLGLIPSLNNKALLRFIP